jgi:hypothetical protein
VTQAKSGRLASALGDRVAAMSTAYRVGGMTDMVLAAHSGLSVSHLERLIGSEQVKYKT